MTPMTDPLPLLAGADTVAFLVGVAWVAITLKTWGGAS